MGRTVKAMFDLIRTEFDSDFVFKDEDGVLTPESLEKMYLLLKGHDLLNLFGDALYKNNLTEISPVVYKRASRKQMVALYRTERLKYEFEALCDVFEEAKLPFIPLKGSILREYYPENWMRTSCDIDIFMKEEDTDKAAKLIKEKLHYRLHRKEAYDISFFLEDTVHFELHYDLIDDFRAANSKEILKKVWEYSEPAEGKKYYHRMNDEMFYMYHIAHMAKHFENGGCGIRPFIDLWVLNHRIPFDKDKRAVLLESAGLTRFEENARKLSEVWFGEETHDKITEKFERYILDGGTYGNIANRIAVQQNRENGKLGFFLSRAFISYDSMKLYFPRIGKFKILFPFLQVVRWFRILFQGRAGRSINELRLNGSVSKEDYNETAEFLKNLGL